MNKNNLLILLFAVVLYSACACERLQDEDFPEDMEKLSLMAETNDVNLLSLKRSNWVPGGLFPVSYGYDKPDYVIFPQIGSVSLEPFAVYNMMVPVQYQDYTGVAPERSFVLNIVSEQSFSNNGNILSVNINNVKAHVVFQSGYACMLIPHQQSVKLSASGNMVKKETDSGVNYVGDMVLTIQLSDGQVLTMKYTDLYLVP